MSKGTVNKVILLGRMGQDPEIKYSQSGVAIANVSLATNEGEKQADGTWKDRTEWHRVVAFGKTAEVIGNFCSKGSQVFVEGSLRTRQWEDKEGAKRYTTEIVVRDVTLLGSGDNSQNRTSQPATVSQVADEDIPF